MRHIFNLSLVATNFAQKRGNTIGEVTVSRSSVVKPKNGATDKQRNGKVGIGIVSGYGAGLNRSVRSKVAAAAAVKQGTILLLA